jgi:hypothetical protein
MFPFFAGGAAVDDFISISRPQGGGFDIGAYEYVVSEVVPRPLAIPGTWFLLLRKNGP